LGFKGKKAFSRHCLYIIVGTYAKLTPILEGKSEIGREKKSGKNLNGGKKCFVEFSVKRLEHLEHS